MTQQRQTQGGGNFDSVRTTYDALGRPYKVSLPYTALATGETSPVIRGQTARLAPCNK